MTVRAVCLGMRVSGQGIRDGFLSHAERVSARPIGSAWVSFICGEAVSQGYDGVSFCVLRSVRPQRERRSSTAASGSMSGVEVANYRDAIRPVSGRIASVSRRLPVARLARATIRTPAERYPHTAAGTEMHTGLGIFRPFVPSTFGRSASGTAHSTAQSSVPSEAAGGRSVPPNSGIDTNMLPVPGERGPPVWHPPWAEPQTASTTITRLAKPPAGAPRASARRMVPPGR